MSAAGTKRTPRSGVCLESRTGQGYSLELPLNLEVAQQFRRRALPTPILIPGVGTFDMCKRLDISAEEARALTEVDPLKTLIAKRKVRVVGTDRIPKGEFPDRLPEPEPEPEAVVEVEVVAPPEAPATGGTQEAAEQLPAMTWKLADLRAHAESLGIALPMAASKTVVLQAIRRGKL